VLLFAVATTALIALIEPVFGEVLLAGGEEVPGALGSLLGAGSEEGSETPGGASVEPDSSAPRKAQSSKKWIKRWMDEGYQELKARLGIDRDNVVFFLPLLVVGIYLLRAGADFLSGYAFQKIGFGVTTDIRNDLYRKILGQSSRFFSSHPTGELVSRVVADVAMMQNAVSSRLLDLVRSGITLVFLIFLLLSTHLRLAVICLVIAPMLVIPIVRFGRGMRKFSHRSQERLADLASLVTEGVRGHRVVKAFGMLEFEDRRFQDATGRHLRANLRAQLLNHLAGPVVETMAVIGAAALLIYSGVSIREGTLTAPVLIQFLSNLMIMYEPLRRLNKVNLVLQQTLAAAQRVFHIMDLENDIHDPESPVTLGSFRREIRFDEVHFSYGREPVLRGVDLTVRKGEVVAIVGKSGAGKSTLVNLLPRFFDPTSGTVLLDGTDVRSLSLEELRSMIGIVTQDTILFDDTVRANIAYGRADMPLERVRQAAEAAFAQEFIDQLPEGYETRIGESGLELSGGQRQRLAIARALLKNAPILILDEATSHLDSHAEALVQQALSNLLSGRTTLVIAHRLATVTQADRIVVLDKGRVVEEGTHEQLLEQGGVYRELYDLQFAV